MFLVRGHRIWQPSATLSCLPVIVIVLGIAWISILSADAFTKQSFRTVQECEVVLLKVASDLILSW
jgi:uncharacterized membrane protein